MKATLPQVQIHEREVKKIEGCVSPLPTMRTPVVVTTPGTLLEESPMIKKLRIKKSATIDEIENIEAIVVQDLINKIKRIVKLQIYNKEETEEERKTRKKMIEAVRELIETYRKKFIFTFRPDEAETDDEDEEEEVDEEKEEAKIEAKKKAEAAEAEEKAKRKRAREEKTEMELLQMTKKEKREKIKNPKQLKTDSYGNLILSDYETLLPRPEEEQKPLKKVQPDCLINIKYLAAELIADLTKDKAIKVLKPPAGFVDISKKRKQKLLATIQPFLHPLLFCLQLMHQYPMIVFIGGTSGVGKSTITTKLAHLFNVTRLLSTDHVRDIYRSIHKEKYKAYLDAVKEAQAKGEPIPEEPLLTYPTSDVVNTRDILDDEHERDNWEPSIPISLLYKSSFQTGHYKGGLVTNFEKQAGYLLPFLAEFIHTSWAKRPEPIIIEGVHMTPQVQEILINSLSNLKTKPLIYRMSVMMHSPTMHQLHLESRSTIAQLQKGVANRYVSHFKEIRSIQAHLISPIDADIDYCHILIDTSDHVDYIMHKIAKNMINFWLKHVKQLDTELTPNSELTPTTTESSS